ncbi:MAG: hypothetical protein RDU76_11860 [Candidatus Edwardsbacteria bacterium]|nr:hypothetical protein [Candidatus Edwardsbacteria bacterium]
MPDYLPRPDSVFDRWVADFIEYSTKHRSELGLTDGEAAELQKARNSWNQAFARHKLAQEAARLATEDKENKRAAVEQVIRKYVRVIQARPATTNKQRRGLGISLKPEEAEESAVSGAAVSISEVSLAGY